jgi:hypothetical protein
MSTKRQCRRKSNEGSVAEFPECMRVKQKAFNGGSSTARMDQGSPLVMQI